MRNDWANIYSCLESIDAVDQIELIVMHQAVEHVGCEEWQLKLSSRCETRITCTEVEGPGRGRNRGISLAQGEWILFWDSDDYVYADKVLEVIHKFTDNTTVIIGDYETIDPKGTIQRAQFQPKNVLDLGMNLGLWRIVFKTESIRSVEFPDVLMAEDQIFFHRTKPSNRTLIFTKDLFYRYKIGDANSLTKDQGSLRQLVLALRIMLTEYVDGEKKLFSVLIFKQILALRHLGVSSLVQTNLLFLIGPKSLKAILRGSILYFRVKLQPFKFRN
jgi:glycosyltransferase involved in cell wall biosynthesis